jgi:hypothetical protein
VWPVFVSFFFDFKKKGGREKEKESRLLALSGFSLQRDERRASSVERQCSLLSLALSLPTLARLRKEAFPLHIPNIASCAPQHSVASPISKVESDGRGEQSTRARQKKLGNGIRPTRRKKWFLFLVFSTASLEMMQAFSSFNTSPVAQNL